MQVVREFSRMLNDALDMRVEMRNMITLGEMLAHREHLEVPTPYEQLCSARVLTMSRVTGRPLDGADAIEGSGWDVEDVTSTVVSAYFEMIFNHGVFHADPQPGNLMVLPGKKLALLDFGDVGRLNPSTSGAN